MDIKKERRKIAFIINPISGNKNKKTVTRLINTVLSQKSEVDYEIILWSSPEQKDEIIKKIRESNYDTAVAVGGDGTINQVAQGLINTNTALGIIPMGSGNGLARHLKIPLSPEKSLEIILKGKRTKIDAGEINNHLFLCTSGIGFDALIGNLFATSKSRGFVSYFKLTIGALLKYNPEKYVIIIDGKELSENAFLITIANASQYGNNAYIAPHAVIDDGLFNVVVLKKFPYIKIPAIAIRMFNKTIEKSPYINTLKARQVEIKRSIEAPIHFDGEPATEGTTIKAKVLASSVIVIIP